MAKVIMVVGGSRSGKSAFAEQMAANLAFDYKQEVYYIATGTICDDDFAQRVRKHQERRPSSWHTIEEPYVLDIILTKHIDKPGIYLIDGIGTWITNLMYEDNLAHFNWGNQEESAFFQKLDSFIRSWKSMQGTIILIADEVGMGIVPENAQARIFRDLNGWANQRLAQEAQEVHHLVCGIGLRIK